jgi:hypothetical protein
MRHGWSLPLALITTGVMSASGGQLVREGAYWVETVTGGLPLEDGGVLRVHVKGAVTVRGGAGEGVRYTLKKRVRAQSEAEARSLLDQLRFRAASTSNGASLSMTFPPRPAAAAELQIVTRPRLRQARVETQAGDVQIYDVLGSVHVESGAGIIQMDRIAGAVVARTAGGDIRLGRIDGPVRSFTGGGRIEVDRSTGESWFETAGGEIVIRESEGPVHASTAGGNIRIGRSGGAVSARSSGGRIEVEQASGIVVAGTLGGAIHVGSARGVRLEAAGGSIQLRGSSGALRAVSDVGSILAELAAGAAIQDSLLSTGAGDITVFIPSNIPLTVRAQNEIGRAGRIVSEFTEIPVRQAIQARRAAVLAEGSLNGGGPVLLLNASGGTIYLRRVQH